MESCHATLIIAFSVITYPLTVMLRKKKGQLECFDDSLHVKVYCWAFIKSAKSHSEINS
jgi:hypothetical protein